LEARKRGIAIVHQELAFCPNLSVAENLCLGDMPRKFGVVDQPALMRRAQKLLSDIGSDIDPTRLISTLSTGQEQLVQIAAALGINAKIMVMDEPTSSLSAGESDRLFTLLSKLKTAGLTIIYVSHRMEEIFRLCDAVTVLRDGKHVGTSSIASTTPEKVISQMVGRNVEMFRPGHVDQKVGKQTLEVKGLSSPGKFRDINFTIADGEVVGFAGLVGSGRSEIAQAIFGLDNEAQGTISVAGRELELRNVQKALSAGIGLLPEDRKRQGLVLGLNCRENGSLAALSLLTKFGFVMKRQEKILVEGYSSRLRVKTPSLEFPVGGLSGGNQQKIALLKWLARNCKVLLVDEPTRGVDIGAKAEIHQILDQLAQAGMAILIISSELPEVMSLSRRILVLRQGQIAGELKREEFSESAIMKLMAGLNTAN
jgi:ABC-type sugar transport system ATPase subunit